MRDDEDDKKPDSEDLDAQNSTPEESKDSDVKQDGEEDGEDLAANWESMLEEQGSNQDDIDAMLNAASGEENNERLLSQNEIDSLLGFSSGSDSQKTSGIQAIISSELIYYERLPMLEVVFDRFVRLITTSIRNFTSDNVEVTLDSITTVRFGDYLNNVPLPALLGVFKAEEWDNFGLITVDSPLIYSIVDVLLGGRKGNSSMRIEGRPYTTIEQNLIERLVKLLMVDLSYSFEPISPVTFRLDRLETNPRFATIGRPANAAVLIEFTIEMDTRGGEVQMALPYATLEPIRELLLQNFMGEKFGRDSIWEGHLGNELWSTDVTLEAILDKISLPLKDVLSLEIGSHITLNAELDSLMEVVCGDKAIFSGKLGKKKQNLAIRLEKNLLQQSNEV